MTIFTQGYHIQPIFFFITQMMMIFLSLAVTISTSTFKGGGHLPSPHCIVYRPAGLYFYSGFWVRKLSLLLLLAFTLANICAVVHRLISRDFALILFVMLSLVCMLTIFTSSINAIRNAFLEVKFIYCFRLIAATAQSHSLFDKNRIDMLNISTLAPVSAISTIRSASVAFLPVFVKFVYRFSLTATQTCLLLRHFTLSPNIKPPRGLVGAVVEAASSKALEGVDLIIVNMRLNKNSALLGITASTRALYHRTGELTRLDLV